MVPHLHPCGAELINNLGGLPQKQNIRTKTHQQSCYVVIKVQCATAQQIDATWRMLSYVPDADFQPVEIYLAGELHYTVIRVGGEQTTAQPGDRRECNCPAA